jgi:hypothetical protein
MRFCVPAQSQLHLVRMCPIPSEFKAVLVPFGFESDVRSDMGPYHDLAFAGIGK